MATFFTIDDSKTMRRILVDILESAGYEYLGEAKSADESITKLISLKTKPDYITLDIKMPGKPGDDVLEEILNISPYSKVFIVSSSYDRSKILKCIGLGACGYLLKPIKSEELKKAFKDKEDFVSPHHNH